MTVNRTLEDPTYAGRGGGYIARISGKLLYEVATAGQRQLFLPAPDAGTPFRVYAGSDASASPLYEVPAQFYEALFYRIEHLFGTESESRSIEYGGVSYGIRLTRVAAPDSGVVLSVTREASGAGT